MGESSNGVIMYGVLNWGLGHATRSVPVIHELLRRGFTPVIASDGAALSYLQKEFPELDFEELPGYGIRYSQKWNALLAVILQWRKILNAQKAEKRVLKELVKKYSPVGIISDNRLGLYHPDIPSAYVSHQLKLMLPFARRMVSRWHHRFIQDFDECWIPDFAGTENLSGELAHSFMPELPVKYMGALSRFSEIKLPEKELLYDACIILSGPEPQRSLLEEKIRMQLAGLPGKFILIRGTSQPRPQQNHPGHIEQMDFAGTDEIASFVRSAKVVVSRSGYSSVMDYYFLKNRALLIPTPGQPEQEYLARYLLHKGYFLYSSQEHLNLKEQLMEAEKHPGFREDFAGRASWEDLFSLFEGK